MYEGMLRDQLTAAAAADADATTRLNGLPLDLAADLERMMVASGELSPYKGSDTEMDEVPAQAPTQTEEPDAAPTQTEEPDAAAGGPQQQQQQQDKEDRPSGGLLVNNP